MKTNNNEENSVSQPKYEELLSISEKNKRIKQNILWKNHPELVDKNKFYYTEEDKKLIKQLLYNPIPPEYRSEYWFISTGAKLEMKNNPGYYKKLVDLISELKEFPGFEQIDKDVPRTFQSFKKSNNNGDLIKLSNILKAFTIRNCSSQKYYQGFNYIAAQLLIVLQDEERAFWCFTKIMEDYLPFYYYFNTVGIKLDIYIMNKIILRTFKFLEKNEGLAVAFQNLMIKCFASLFTEVIDMESTCVIWDNFFINGEVAFFHASIFYCFYLFKDGKNYDTQQALKLIKDANKIKNIDLLNYFLLMNQKVDDSLLNAVKKIKLKYFLAKIPEENKVNEEIICDPKSPYCFYNKSTKNIKEFPKYKIFKLKENIKKNENYFSDLFNNDKFCDNNGKVIKNEISKTSNFDDLLIERIEHVCKKENQVENK